MSQFNLNRTRNLLQQFDFQTLFIEELGWSLPRQTRPDTLISAGLSFTRRQIAQLGGVAVFELAAGDGHIPEAKAREAVQRQISEQYYENLLIFVDAQRTQSVWYWVKREGTKRFPRTHHFVKGQTGDLFLGKISAMFVDMSELDEAGHLPVVEVAGRLKAALDVERVTKKFFDEFKLAHTRFLNYISGIDDERERRWYTSVILNRLMFTYFLQRKGFIDRGNLNYLKEKLAASRSQAAGHYYANFLQTLFFEGFARPKDKRDPTLKAMLGEITYLNGGLFLPHPIEEKYGDSITIPDAAFAELFDLFERYSWNLDDTLGGRDDEINPDVLGYIFEKYINQKEFGAYYTRPEITEYLCEQTIHRLILDRLAELNQPVPGLPAPPQFDSIGDLLLKLDAARCRQLLFDILPKLSLLDPAAGSGAFLVAALKMLLEIYQALVGRIPFFKDEGLSRWLAQADHPSLDYFLKKQIITQNLYGVDIMAEAVEIARLRLFLALVASVQTVADLEPLPNIDFNILPGNSLIGLLRVDEAAFNRRAAPGEVTQLGLFAASKAASYQETVAEKNRLIRTYKFATGLSDDLQSLRDAIQAHRQQANTTLNHLLLDNFGELGILFEQTTWDEKKNQVGKPKKRPLILADVEALQPFHWGYEFDEVMNERGGFDAIITNPPWEIFKPQAKEFFADFSNVVTKNKMAIKEFEKEQGNLLKDNEVKNAWLSFLSKFPHQSQYFRRSPQYKNQISIINGKKAGSDINLYKLFVEQSRNLLRDKGYCGIVIPSGIYTDLGTKQLRELLLNHSQINNLISLSNERNLFEGVMHNFKFCLLTYKRDKPKEYFNVSFRIYVHEAVSPNELDSFLSSDEVKLRIPIKVVQEFAPESLSIMEYKKQVDLEIANRLISSPMLGEQLLGSWNFKLTREFDMTNDSWLFKTSKSKGGLVLYEGKMIYQYTHLFSTPQYWIDEKDGRKAILGKNEKDTGQKLEYQDYRLGIRAVGGSANKRGLIATILPKNVFCGNSILVSTNKALEDSLSNENKLLLLAFLNSYPVDYCIRQMVATNINMFYIYQLHIPRLTKRDPAFAPIVERAAKLVCTTPEFDDLAREVGLGNHKNGVTEPSLRAQLRAELDGLIAHIYGFTEEEFSYILSTFPVVDEEVKKAALQEYRRLAPDPEVITLIAGGESERVEFKEAARRNPYTGKDEGQKMSDNLVRAVAGMMNGAGGTLLIGVADDGTVKGVTIEYDLINKSKPTWDSYRLFLEGLLKDKLSIPNAFQFYQISRHPIEGKDVCRIQVLPASTPVYVDKKLYIRDGNKTAELQGPDLVAYVQSGRWESWRD